LLRERPRPHQRHLPAQEIRADVERDLTPQTMGGYGSGRYGGRPTVESAVRLDITGRRSQAKARNDKKAPHLSAPHRRRQGHDASRSKAPS
jgi:hypothetical protein